MKDSAEVIREFNEVVNMTASELEKWLKSGDSQSAGWPKAGDEQGDNESVGHDSGRNIVKILSSNPKKDPKKYTEDQIKHMRKVVSYCKRHLAQEEKSNGNKSDAEVKKTKSYASLKNWGHDPLKKRAQKKNGDNDDDEESQEESHAQGDDEDDDLDKEEENKEAGDKRKNANGQSTAQKTRKTKSNSDASKGKKQQSSEDDDEEGSEEEEEDEEEDEEDEEEEEDDDDDNKAQNKNGQQSKSSSKGPEKGEKVSWAWGSGHPEGKVLDVKPEKTSVTTKRGNKVSRDGSKDDPAVVLDTGKSKAIKLDHELD